MQIRDQIFAVLTSFNTKDLSLESKVIIPGWVRTLRQCLIIDKDGKIQEVQLVGEYFKSFIKEGLELAMPDGTYPFTLHNLLEAFDFALISEGILKSDKVYDEANVLKVRLHNLINSNYREFFNVETFITRDQYINKLITTKTGTKAQVVNFNINYVDDRFAKTIVKLISKMLLEYSVSLENRASFPVHLFLEEAHRYVQNDSDIDVIGYNIFERITKEGRKYGVVLGMVSQRPSEISETAISQCTNFLVFRIQHPRDLNYIREMVPNISEEMLGKFKILQPGTCMAFGSAFKIPLLLRIEAPNPPPYSQNADMNKTWYE
jgi:DNA helicase HerA-like ATPase